MPWKAHTPTAAERAVSAAAQRESWRKDPHHRRKQLTLGHVAALLRRHPSDLREVLEAAVDAARDTDAGVAS